MVRGNSVWGVVKQLCLSSRDPWLVVKYLSLVSSQLLRWWATHCLDSGATALPQTTAVPPLFEKAHCQSFLQDEGKEKVVLIWLNVSLRMILFAKLSSRFREGLCLNTTTTTNNDNNNNDLILVAAFHQVKTCREPWGCVQSSSGQT